MTEHRVDWRRILALIAIGVLSIGHGGRCEWIDGPRCGEDPAFAATYTVSGDCFDGETLRIVAPVSSCDVAVTLGELQLEGSRDTEGDVLGHEPFQFTGRDGVVNESYGLCELNGDPLRLRCFKEAEELCVANVIDAEN